MPLSNMKNSMFQNNVLLGTVVFLSIPKIYRLGKTAYLAYTRSSKNLDR